jgi:preprotein translocase subunit SecG
MGVLEIILVVILVIVELILIAAVLLQSGKSAGLSGSITGGAETFFGKNKAKTLDGKLQKATKIAAGAFIVVTVVLTMLL